MAREHRTAASRGLDGESIMGIANAPALFNSVGDHFNECRIGLAVFPHVVFPEFRNVAKLALAGGMVHERYHSDPIVRAELAQFIDQRVRTDLGPKMDHVADTEHVGGPELGKLGRHFPGVGSVMGVVTGIGTDTQSIKNRSNTRGRQLAVVSEDRWDMGDLDAGAGHHVAFEIVSMEFDKARNKVIAREINRTLPGRTLGNLGDFTTFNCDAAGHHFLRQNEPCIAKLETL